MAAKAAAVGARKAGLPAVTTVTLGVLAGAFIALGGVFATTVGAGSPGALPWGIVRGAQGVAGSSSCWWAARSCSRATPCW